MKLGWIGKCLGLMVGLSCFGGFFVPTLPAAPLYAGTAKADITPAPGTAIDLLGRPLQPRDSLFARVLTLQLDQLSLAIVSIDSIVFASPRVIEQAKARWGVDHVILSSTHTHSGTVPRGMIINPPQQPDWTRSGRSPADTIDWRGLSADPWYADAEEKIIVAIGEALRNPFEAHIIAGTGGFESAYMAHNRRLVRDGKVTAFWENPDRRPTQPIDPTVGVIRVEDRAGKPRAFAVHYACHPVSLMGCGFVARDFPGAMVDHLEQELGDNCLAMFLQGAQGDLDPYDLQSLRGENRFNISNRAGISLAKGALRVAATLNNAATSSQAEPEPTLQVKVSLLTIPNRSGAQSTEIGLLTAAINRNMALVAIPGEPFIQLQLNLAAQSPLPNARILGLAYHGAGTPFAVYIPTAQAVQEGGYGATECSFVAPQAGEMMISAALATLRELIQNQSRPDAR